MKLLLVRHGETDWNLARRYQGQSAVSLNQNGIQQAEQLTKRLSNEKINALYSSDAPRALETAKYIANLYEPVLAIQSDSRWQEICFGAWDG
jgi:broad specificity phosphatase PhoE